MCQTRKKPLAQTPCEPASLRNLFQKVDWPRTTGRTPFPATFPNDNEEISARQTMDQSWALPKRTMQGVLPCLLHLGFRAASGHADWHLLTPQSFIGGPRCVDHCLPAENS